MKNIKFDSNGNITSQKVNYKIRHEEETEDLIEKYITNKCNFDIKFDEKGDVTFKEKEKRQRVKLSKKKKRENNYLNIINGTFEFLKGKCLFCEKQIKRGIFCDKICKDLFFEEKKEVKIRKYISKKKANRNSSNAKFTNLGKSKLLN